MQHMRRRLAALALCTFVLAVFWRRYSALTSLPDKNDHRDPLKHLRPAESQKSMDSLTSLVEWSVSCGASVGFREWKVVETFGVRGVASRRSYKKGEVIGYLPQECEISADTARKVSNFNSLPPELPVSKDDYVALAVFALTRHGGRFAQYYKAMPQSFANFPRFWPAHVLALVRGSALFDQVQAQLSEWIGYYSILREQLREFDTITLQAFLEAMTIVFSREYSRSADDVSDIDDDNHGERRPRRLMEEEVGYAPVLLPVLDLRNFNSFQSRLNTRAEWNQTGKTWVVKALHDISAGSQLFEDYGKYWARRADYILGIFGFVTDCDALGTVCEYAPQVQLSHGIVQDIRARGLRDAIDNVDKRELYYMSRDYQGAFTFRITYKLESFCGTLAELLQALRVAFLQQVPTSDQIDDARDHALSWESEARVMSELIVLIEAAKQLFGLSEAEVSAQLLKKRPGSPEHSALWLVLGELRVLDFWSRAASAVIPLLRMRLPNISKYDWAALKLGDASPKAHDGLAEYLRQLRKLGSRGE